MKETVLVEQQIDVEAPADVVFELLTDPLGLLEWVAVEAESEAVVGGTLRWRYQDGSAMSGRYTRIERPSRIEFTFGWEEGGVAEVPPGSSRVAIELREERGVTHVRLVHSLLPAAAAGRHSEGWRWFLPKLAASAAERARSRRDEGGT